MESLTNLKAGALASIMAIGSVLANLFGGWDTDLQTLLIFMSIDYISGLVVAGVFKKSNKSESGALESRAGWKGIVKKCMTLLLVLMGNQLDIIMQVNYIRTGLIIAFLVDEGMSILENAGLMGMPMPEMLKNAFDILKKKEAVKEEVGR